jgi:Domain of unknown function (DUF1876)
MKQTGEAKVWSVEVLLDETPDKTQAEAVLELEGRRYAGWGRARRNPEDPDVPRIGEELAAARALSDLGHKLLEAAAEAIEAFEGNPVRGHQ